MMMMNSITQETTLITIILLSCRHIVWTFSSVRIPTINRGPRQLTQQGMASNHLQCIVGVRMRGREREVTIWMISVPFLVVATGTKGVFPFHPKWSPISTYLSFTNWIIAHFESRKQKIRFQYGLARFLIKSSPIPAGTGFPNSGTPLQLAQITNLMLILNFFPCYVSLLPISPITYNMIFAVSKHSASSNVSNNDLHNTSR